MDIDIFDGLCRSLLGTAPEKRVSLPQAGGDREYWRLSMPCGCIPDSVLGVKADSVADAKAFVGLADVFEDNDVNVPSVIASSDDCRYYIVEDLGECSLFSMLGSEAAAGLVGKTLDELVRMQTVPLSEWQDVVAYKPFSRRQILWDFNYFKYEYLKNSSVAFDEDALEDDFEAFADRLLSFPRGEWGFMMRDCQSRNVMVRGNEPFFIDFQGGRFGPCLYDAVSFLWQAKAGFGPDFRDVMVSRYISALAAAKNLDARRLHSELPFYVLLRTLQVLGAYGYRGLVQKRAHFVESIPGALVNLRRLVEDGTLGDFKELERVCRLLVDDCRFNRVLSDGKLHVKVFSFSYKRGYPADYSGNGGGFMFDCRGMHNPGRYEEYRQLTGLDAPVIGFLKQKGEIDLFVDKAIGLVSPTVTRYIKRGFSSLQIGFGCTGGRHRSVYSAQAVAQKLAVLFPDAIIELFHREQNISQFFNVE